MGVRDCLMLAGVVTACLTPLIVLALAGRWIWRRADVSDFAHSITAQPADVAATEAELPDMRTDDD